MSGRYKSLLRIAVTIWFCAGMTACDRMVTPSGKQILRDADAKSNESDFASAINLYEHALDGTAASADVHYKLALLYDDKLSEPLNAIHHFKRYLAVAPNGPRALDVKGFIKRDEVSLLTSLSGDSLVTRADAARLRNDNLALRKELEDQRAKANVAASSAPTQNRAKKPKTRRTPSPH